jgi:hypothetical protein
MTPWPSCKHGDDPTVCRECVADIDRMMARARWNPRLRLRWAWLDLRERFRRGGPF